MHLDSCKGTILCIALNLQIDNTRRKEMAGSRDRKSPWLPFTNGFFGLACTFDKNNEFATL